MNNRGRQRKKQNIVCTGMALFFFYWVETFPRSARISLRDKHEAALLFSRVAYFLHISTKYLSVALGKVPDDILPSIAMVCHRTRQRHGKKVDCPRYPRTQQTNTQSNMASRRSLKKRRPRTAVGVLQVCNCNAHVGFTEPTVIACQMTYLKRGGATNKRDSHVTCCYRYFFSCSRSRRGRTCIFRSMYPCGTCWWGHNKATVRL